MRAGHYRRRALRARRAERAARGIKERRQRMVWRVEVTAIAVPAWARARALRGLTSGEAYLWLRRGDAKMLERLDREAGGEPMVIEAEFRRCKICWRPLLGDDAAARRAQELGGATADQLPCGPECYDASKDKRWRHG